MALNITVRKNYLPACASPFIVCSDCSEVIEYERLVDLMAKGRTTLTKTDILAAMQLYREELVIKAFIIKTTRPKEAWA